MHPRAAEAGGRCPPAPPGRNLRFLHLPVFSQNHAAVSARPRFARTLRVSLRSRQPHGIGNTLGALPLTPRQEPDVPAPPGFFSKPCCRFSSSALRANFARVFARPSAAYGSRGTPSPCTPCQGTEFPGPSAFHPCLRYQRFRIYSSASVHHRPLCALQISSRSPKRLSFSAAFPNSSIAVSGISILL